ncbi:MAG: hypothetical protein EOO59_20020 [Hymenobacter sp.]|nr:MAG: hypothetical protein EOO59_20020 [Hymenobacter sp.]
MTDEQLNFQGMARNVRRLLADTAAQWQPLYPKLATDVAALDAALAVFDTAAQARVGIGTQGYTDARDLAEVAALDAAMPVLRGLRAVQLDAPDPALAPLTQHSRTTLDALREQTQLATLKELLKQARLHAAALADERVTAAHLQALADQLARYEPLLGTARQQVASGAVLRTQAVAALAAARIALKRLDVRVPNLQDDLPALVETYRKTRVVVDAGHGPKPTA